MVGSKARCSMIQFVPSKPTQYGFKVWCSADSVTGYIIDFELYEGKDEESIEEHEEQENVDDAASNDSSFASNEVDTPTSIESLVVRLCDALPQNRNFNIFADSLFASVRIARQLASNGRYICGTVKLKSTQLPSLTSGAKLLEKGESLSVTDVTSDVAVYAKRSKKAFGIVSSIHSPIKFSADEARDDYNKKARGVDLSNQQLATYDPQRRTLRWWHSLFDFMLNASVCNAYVLFSSKVTNSQRELKFSLDLIEQILRRFCTNKILASPVNVSHIPKRSDQSNTCRQCSKSGKSGWSVYYCAGCSKSQRIHLHPRCFELYHSHM